MLDAQRPCCSAGLLIIQFNSTYIFPPERMVLVRMYAHFDVRIYLMYLCKTSLHPSSITHTLKRSYRFQFHLFKTSEFVRTGIIAACTFPSEQSRMIQQKQVNYYSVFDVHKIYQSTTRCLFHLLGAFSSSKIAENELTLTHLHNNGLQHSCSQR